MDKIDSDNNNNTDVGNLDENRGKIPVCVTPKVCRSSSISDHRNGKVHENVNFSNSGNIYSVYEILFLC